MPLLQLTADEVLTTTRTVRKRLDLTRPVEREVLRECLAIAQQAPSGSNQQRWAFVVVTDAAKRAAIAELFRRGGERYLAARATDPTAATPTQQRLLASVRYLIDHMHEVPVHVIPCIAGRTDGQPGGNQGAHWASIIPAAWSFMLAARSRGLGTAWTSFHLHYGMEEEMAQILGIPYADYMQAALIPVAYTLGTDFKPAAREPLDQMVHWDGW